MRRKERTVLRGVLLVSCIALGGWLLQPTAWSTRGCGVCSRQIVRMCDESGCGPFPACHGSCECEEWEWQNCQGDGMDCRGVQSLPVNVLVHPGDCDAGSLMCVCRRIAPPFWAVRNKDVCKIC